MSQLHIDPGLAAWLLQIRSADQLAGHSMRGPLFETWVFSELVKARCKGIDAIPWRGIGRVLDTCAGTTL